MAFKIQRKKLERMMDQLGLDEDTRDCLREANKAEETASSKGHGAPPCVMKDYY